MSLDSAATCALTGTDAAWGSVLFLSKQVCKQGKAAILFLAIVLIDCLSFPLVSIQIRF